MAIRSRFIPGTGMLATFGDDLDNNIVISRNAAGQLLVNGGAVAIHRRHADGRQHRLIQVFGLGGNDTITLNEANGALPRANIFGGAGNDIITGGSGGDSCSGQAATTRCSARAASTSCSAATGNDILTGGDADDQVFGEGGNDRMIWNPGDDTDLFEGGAGNDTAEVNGGNGAETVHRHRERHARAF